MKDRFGNDWSGVKGAPFWTRPIANRRLFFRHAAAAIGGYFLLPARPMETVARAAAPNTKGTARNVIFVMMAGGPSHVDTFDLKEGPWTPEFAAPTSYGDVRWPQGLMPTLATHLDKSVLVRSVRSWAAVHQLAQTWVQIGRNPISGLSRIAPHIGSVVSLELTVKDQVLPTFVNLATSNGPAQGYLKAQHSPFYVTNVAGQGLGNSTHPLGPDVFARRYNLLQQMDADERETTPNGGAYEEMAAFNLSARRLMYNEAVNDVFRFDADTRTRYGATNFGNACILARNILRAAMGTRFIQINLGGWDHHQGIYQPNALQALSRTFDLGLGNLIADLNDSGLLNETLIIAMGEFGRTVGPLNNQAGRDHFLQQAVLMAGGGIKGGRALGSTDELGRLTMEPGWRHYREIRAEDIEATIYSALGIDWTTIRRDDPLGRGFEYVPRTGPYPYEPIDELWA
jgi:hypothetical protein